MKSEDESPGKAIELSYDVGHSSIGWAVFRAVEEAPHIPELLGCGVVTFGADDCLARKRRDYRRQRRHARSTRQRIARIEKLLVHVGALTKEEAEGKHTQGGGHAAPWLLAARVFAGNGEKEYLLDWPWLWDVIRWYAHNRGYDGNVRWANAPAESLNREELEERKRDTVKEHNARTLMEKHGVKTMAETMFHEMFAEANERDPRRVQKLPLFRRWFKGNQCAFPRKVVESEVARLLEHHRAHLNLCDHRFIRLLTARELTGEDRVFLERAGIQLPKRYKGGLLFGQLVPRFDNRIIAECPAQPGVKVPTRNCIEFLNFRWAMKLAEIGVGFGEEKYEQGAKLRPLNSEERRKIDARVRRLGFLRIEADKPGKDGVVRAGKNELRDIVREETNCDRHNLDTLLLTPDAKEALKLVPVKGDTKAFRIVWESFSDPQHDSQDRYHDDTLRHRFTTQLLRGRSLTAGGVLAELRSLKRDEAVKRLDDAIRKASSDKKGASKPAELAELMNAEFHCEKLKGRARYCRDKMREAFQQVFHKTKPIHPFAKGGCLEQTDAIVEAKLSKSIDRQTNNHLVRHRLKILCKLNEHLIAEYANGRKLSVTRITVEVGRDLQTMSGMTNKAKAKELAGKVKQHHDIAAQLAEELKDERDEKGRPFRITPGLIRKARIAADLAWECPYTGRIFREPELAHRTYDKDHIVPRSKRLSDALEALVITSQEVNKVKRDRTALQFIKEMNEPQNRELRDRLGIRTEAQFRAFVEKLPTRGGHRDDVVRRQRRKQLLLVEKYEDKGFTPADLTKTRHLNKLAMLQLEAQFEEIKKEMRPAIIPVPGAVTAMFRDKAWKLLPLLNAANEQVLKLQEEKEAALDFNLKEAIRNLTHMHHALDAISIGFVVGLLIPPGRSKAGLDGELARLIQKRKLTGEERKSFESLKHSFGLGKFYYWGQQAEGTSETNGAVLCLAELPKSNVAEIRARLSEKRVVQHIPSDMSGLRVEENTRGIESIEKGRVRLRQQNRDEKSGKFSINRTEEATAKVLGTEPVGESRLRPIKGARVIEDNFGVAILDKAQVEERFAVIPHHKVWHRVQELKMKNDGTMPRILRIGTLVSVPNKAGKSDYRGMWMIRGVQRNAKQGILVDLSHPDTIEYRVSGRLDCFQNVRLQSLCDGGLEILKPTLAGIPCPTTSSA